MAGIVYINKNSSTISLTSSVLFECPDQYKKVRIRTNTTAATGTIGFGLTTDSTASEYSPAIMYTNNTVCYLGTYSTGSSSGTGICTYTAESGYQQVQTGATALTERRTGSGQVSYQVSGTERYVSAYSYTSYYSLLSSCESTYTYYGDSDGGHDESPVSWISNPPSAGIREVWTKPKNKNSSTMTVYTGMYNSTTAAGTGYRSPEKGKAKIAWRYQTHVDGPHEGLYSVFYRTVYVYTWYNTEWAFSNKYGGYVTKNNPLYGTRTTYTTSYSSTNGIYTATTSWKYGYSNRYTERTYTAINTDGQFWTSSNINVY